MNHPAKSAPYIGPCKVGPYKVGIVWRGDTQARAEATPTNNRLAAIFAALSRQGLAAEPAVFCEDAAGDLRDQLVLLDAALVWVDPIATATGQRRDRLDEILRHAAQAGVMVSAHPDVVAKLGVKSVLHRTRSLGWGSDTGFYETTDAFHAAFPSRLARGPRVLKQNRGNGGIGVWKVELAAPQSVSVVEARGGSTQRTLPFPVFMAERLAEFAAGGGLVDQPYQARLPEGMIRCYMSGGQVAGFGHQQVCALAPASCGPITPRLYSGPDDPRFQRLRALMQDEWTPGLARLLDIVEPDLPVIWDADFLLGAKTSDGQNSYVLCEINASSVFPIPEQAPDALAATVLRRLVARHRSTG